MQAFYYLNRLKKAKNMDVGWYAVNMTAKDDEIECFCVNLCDKKEFTIRYKTLDDFAKDWDVHLETAVRLTKTGS